MTNSSWDNGGIAPEKKGFGTGMKVLLGCGVTFLLGIVTCTVGGMVLGNYIKKDPEAFEKHVEGWAKGFIQKDWDRFRALAELLHTDEGTRTIYRTNPNLSQVHSSEDEFLRAVQGWRLHLSSLPVEVPIVVEHRHRRNTRHSEKPMDQNTDSVVANAPSVKINKVFGMTNIECRYPDGTRLFVSFDGDKVSRIEVK